MKLIPFLTLAVSTLVAAQLPAKQVAVDVSMAQPVMAASDQLQTTTIKVGLTGFELPRDGKDRAPVNVAIVLDKSGSMSGEKLAYAKDAAKMAIQRLGSNDILSIITYDHNVEVLVPATKVTDKGAMLAAIDRIRIGGNTALFAGVAKGADEIRKFLDGRLVNRVILLSDGQANVGPRSPGALGNLGASLAKEGIAVTTIGLGNGYNEDLMFALAEKSDGNHTFAENPKMLAEAFDTEFGDILTVAAQEVLVKINCVPGIRPVRVLGRQAEIAGQEVSVMLNQLYSKQEKYILLEVEIPATLAGKTRDIAKVEISYANMSTNTTDEISSKVAVRFSESKKEIDAETNREVIVASTMQIANLENEKAMKLRDAGKVEEAKKILLLNAAACIQAGTKWGDDEIVQFGTNNRIDATNLDGAAWNATRKAMRADQYKNASQQQRGYNSRVNPETNQKIPATK
ncbi:MAG: Ca-activated chloride channel family protein [Verrucomicrobiales bacterium]|jgi:Ca-activated chloride channel family protein